MIPNETYETNGFVLIKNFIPRFFSDYLKEVLNTHRINQDSLEVYGDPAFDTFALMSGSMLPKIIGKALSPIYTHARIYLNDNDHLPHLDEKKCEHSVTIFLGGNYESLWPIWMQKPEVHKTPQLCALEEGDAVIYKGSQVHHWRDNFEGTDYFELTLHYVETDGEYKDYIYDTRPYIGLPSATKREYGTSESQ